MTNPKSTETNQPAINYYEGQELNDTSVAGMCKDSPEEGRHFWYQTHEVPNSGGRFVCGFCLDVIFD